MDLTKYLVATLPPDTDVLVIAFGKVGQELREYPVEKFYEYFTGNSELAADPDFNPFKLLCSGMSSNDIEVVLRDHGYRTFLSAKEVTSSASIEEYQREVDAKYAEFQRDLCIEFSITDMPADFIEQVMDDARSRLRVRKDRIELLLLEDIYRAVRKQLFICRSLIDGLRSCTQDLALLSEQQR